MIYDEVPLPTDLLAALQKRPGARVPPFQLGSWTHPRPHTGLEQFHQEVEEVVAEALRRGGSVLRNQLDRLLHHPVPSIRLLYECTHFSACYVLNRFLTLLLGRYLEEGQGQGSVLWAKRRVGKINSIDGHVCQSDPDCCHGRTHEVTWVGLPDCRQGETSDRALPRQHLDHQAWYRPRGS